VTLEPYDLDKVGCSGPFLDGGYYGQCCVKARCQPKTGGECVEAKTLLWPGSGTCGCSVVDGGSAVLGPYARNPNADDAEGECCYLIGSIGCVGRPLMVKGEAVIAEVVGRKDWAVYA